MKVLFRNKFRSSADDKIIRISAEESRRIIDELAAKEKAMNQVLAGTPFKFVSEASGFPCSIFPREVQKKLRQGESVSKDELIPLPTRQHAYFRDPLTNCLLSLDLTSDDTEELYIEKIATFKSERVKLKNCATPPEQGQSQKPFI